MSDAVEDLIADAVVYELNLSSQAWAPLAFPAQALYDAVFEDPAGLTNLQVIVVPLTTTRKRISRGGLDRFTYGVTIYLGQKVTAPVNRDEIKTLNRIAQGIHDWFRNPHVLTFNAANTIYECIACDRPDLFAADMLWDQSTWETALDVGVEVSR
jgi:hypothetical protein